MISLTKRQKFVISSLSLSLGFLAINLLDNQYRFWAIGGLTALTIIAFFWSLVEGLALDTTLLTLILPSFFTLGVGLFWFLLPSTIFAKLPVVILYGIGIYSLCLTSNIFSVSIIRTIALVRAAKGVGFVLTLFTFFLLFDAILSIRVRLEINALAISLVSLPLFLQGFWQTSLEKKLETKIIIFSLISTFGLIEIGTLLYFWPITVVVGSLFLTVSAYVLLGLGQASIEGRLFKQTARDYLVIATLVFISMFFVTHWGG